MQGIELSLFDKKTFQIIYKLCPMRFGLVVCNTSLAVSFYGHCAMMNVLIYHRKKHQVNQTHIILARKLFPQITSLLYTLSKSCKLQLHDDVHHYSIKCCDSRSEVVFRRLLFCFAIQFRWCNTEKKCTINSFRVC